MPLREYFRDVELVLLVWVGSLLLLASAGIWSLRKLRRPSLRLLALDEEGVSYSLSYVLVFPLLFLFVCIVFESTFVLMAKVGTLYAAHAGARSTLVWSSAQPAEVRADRIGQSVRTAMAPFASASAIDITRSGNNPAAYLGEASDFATAYLAYSSKSAAQPSTLRRPYARTNATLPVLLTRYLSGAVRTTYTIEKLDATPEGDIRFVVTYRAPLHIPGASRILAPNRATPLDFPIRSQAILPDAAPRSIEGGLGIDYRSAGR